ncbi:hypothetical protein ACLB2K_030967 [Fragaria x ananassa]
MYSAIWSLKQFISIEAISLARSNMIAITIRCCTVTVIPLSLYLLCCIIWALRKSITSLSMEFPPITKVSTTITKTPSISSADDISSELSSIFFTCSMVANFIINLMRQGFRKHTKNYQKKVAGNYDSAEEKLQSS